MEMGEYNTSSSYSFLKKSKSQASSNNSATNINNNNTSALSSSTNKSIPSAANHLNSDTPAVSSNTINMSVGPTSHKKTSSIFSGHKSMGATRLSSPLTPKLKMVSKKHTNSNTQKKYIITNENIKDKEKDYDKKQSSSISSRDKHLNHDSNLSAITSLKASKIKPPSISSITPSIPTTTSSPSTSSKISNKHSSNFLSSPRPQTEVSIKSEPTTNNINNFSINYQSAGGSSSTLSSKDHHDSTSTTSHPSKLSAKSPTSFSSPFPTSNLNLNLDSSSKISTKSKSKSNSRSRSRSGSRSRSASKTPQSTIYSEFESTTISPKPNTLTTRANHRLSQSQSSNIMTSDSEADTDIADSPPRPSRDRKHKHKHKRLGRRIKRQRREVKSDSEDALEGDESSPTPQPISQTRSRSRSPSHSHSNSTSPSSHYTNQKSQQQSIAKRLIIDHQNYPHTANNNTNTSSSDQSRSSSPVYSNNDDQSRSTPPIKNSASQNPPTSKNSSSSKSTMMPRKQGVAHIRRKSGKVGRDSGGRSRLQRFCDKGKYNEAKQLLLDGADVNDCDYAGNTSLHEAALKGHTELVRLLLDHGAIINVMSNTPVQDTPLIDAVSNDHIDTVKLLLERGADPRITNYQGQNAMDGIQEDSKNSKELYQILREVSKKFRNKRRQSNEDDTGHSRSPAPDGVYSRSQSVTADGQQQKQTSGKNRRGGSRIHPARNDLLWMDFTTRTGREQVYSKAADGDMEFVGNYLENGGTANADCLSLAAKHGHTNVVSLLLAFGAESDSINEDGSTALEETIGRGHLETVQLLLQSGANPCRRTVDGRTLLDVAKELLGSDDEETVLIREAIINYKKEHNIKDNDDNDNDNDNNDKQQDKEKHDTKEKIRPLKNTNNNVTKDRKRDRDSKDQQREKKTKSYANSNGHDSEHGRRTKKRRLVQGNVMSSMSPSPHVEDSTDDRFKEISMKSPLTQSQSQTSSPISSSKTKSDIFKQSETKRGREKIKIRPKEKIHVENIDVNKSSQVEHEIKNEIKHDNDDKGAKANESNNDKNMKYNGRNKSKSSSRLENTNNKKLKQFKVKNNSSNNDRLISPSITSTDDVTSKAIKSKETTPIEKVISFNDYNTSLHKKSSISSIDKNFSTTRDDKEKRKKNKKDKFPQDSEISINHDHFRLQSKEPIYDSDYNNPKKIFKESGNNSNIDSKSPTNLTIASEKEPLVSNSNVPTSTSENEGKKKEEQKKEEQKKEEQKKEEQKKEEQKKRELYKQKKLLKRRQQEQAILHGLESIEKRKTEEKNQQLREEEDRKQKAKELSEKKKAELLVKIKEEEERKDREQRLLIRKGYPSGLLNAKFSSTVSIETTKRYVPLYSISSDEITLDIGSDTSGYKGLFVVDIQLILMLGLSNFNSLNPNLTRIRISIDDKKKLWRVFNVFLSDPVSQKHIPLDARLKAKSKDKEKFCRLDLHWLRADEVLSLIEKKYHTVVGLINKGSLYSIGLQDESLQSQSQSNSLNSVSHTVANPNNDSTPMRVRLMK